MRVRILRIFMKKLYFKSLEIIKNVTLYSMKIDVIETNLHAQRFYKIIESEERYFYAIFNAFWF